MSTIAYYLHRLDPFIFKVGSIGPRYYGVAYLLGFLFAYMLMQRLARAGMLRIAPSRVPDLVLNACIFGVLVGGRLGFVLFYDLPASLQRGTTPLLWDFSSQTPFWGVLRVWDGGMAAHGGIVFTILYLAWFAWRDNVRLKNFRGFEVITRDAPAPSPTPALLNNRRTSLINIGDASCMVVPIGLFFGRVANFINGELYGHPTNVSWAVKFPSEIYAPTNGNESLSPEALFEIKKRIADFILQHPDQLTRGEVQTFLNDPRHAELAENYRQLFGNINLDAPNQLLLLKQRLAESIGNTPDLIETWNIGAWWQGGHTSLTDAMAGIFQSTLPARHPSQLYEALLEGVLLFLICWFVGWKWRKDGMASGAFLTLYPIMRIIGEQFRVGDTAVSGHIGAGILYSLPMFLGGAIYWAYFIRRSQPRVWVPAPDEPPTQQAASPPAKEANP